MAKIRKQYIFPCLLSTFFCQREPSVFLIYLLVYLYIHLILVWTHEFLTFQLVYNESFWCSNEPMFGQHKFLQIGTCALVTCSFHFLVGGGLGWQWVGGWSSLLLSDIMSCFRLILCLSYSSLGLITTTISLGGSYRRRWLCRKRELQLWGRKTLNLCDTSKIECIHIMQSSGKQTSYFEKNQILHLTYPVAVSTE